MFALRDVRYKDILDIRHLDIPEGQVTCIVGKSGSGKTTLMRLLNRMISPDAGTITYKGTPVTDIDPVQLRRRVVMLPQSPVMFDGTIRENLCKGLVFAGKPMVGDDTLHRIMDVMDLQKDLDGDAGTLSGGEKQRVALGRVLAMQPEVALLDEPSSALDRGTESTIMERLVAGAREYKVTMVIVTHSRPLAESIAENLIEMEAGRVVGPGQRVAS
jgi:putative ABC transport system ATP-binding protein